MYCTFRKAICALQITRSLHAILPCQSHRMLAQCYKSIIANMLQSCCIGMIVCLHFNASRCVFFFHPWPGKVKVPHPADIWSIDNIPSHINFSYFLIILVSP